MGVRGESGDLGPRRHPRCPAGLSRSGLRGRRATSPDGEVLTEPYASIAELRDAVQERWKRLRQLEHHVDRILRRTAADLPGANPRAVSRYAAELSNVARDACLWLGELTGRPLPLPPRAATVSQAELLLDGVLSRLDALCTYAEPSRETVKPKAKPGKNNAPQASVNVRMMDAFQRDPKRGEWSARQWAEHLGCSKSTVHSQPIWKELVRSRELAKLNRQLRDR